MAESGWHLSAESYGYVLSGSPAQIATRNAFGSYATAISDDKKTVGRWYAELEFDSSIGGERYGIVDTVDTAVNDSRVGDFANGVGLETDGTSSATGITPCNYGPGTIAWPYRVAIAVDVDTGYVWIAAAGGLVVDPGETLYEDVEPIAEFFEPNSFGIAVSLICVPDSGQSYCESPSGTATLHVTSAHFLYDIPEGFLAWGSDTVPVVMQPDGEFTQTTYPDELDLEPVFVYSASHTHDVEWSVQVETAQILHETSTDNVDVKFKRHTSACVTDMSCEVPDIDFEALTGASITLDLPDIDFEASAVVEVLASCDFEIPADDIEIEFVVENVSSFELEIPDIDFTSTVTLWIGCSAGFEIPDIDFTGTLNVAIAAIGDFEIPEYDFMASCTVQRVISPVYLKNTRSANNWQQGL